MSSESCSDSEVTMVSAKTRKYKRLKVEAPTKLKPHQMLGETLSSDFLSTVHANRGDISTILDNLGHRKISARPLTSCSSLTLFEDDRSSSHTASTKQAVNERRGRGSKFERCSYSLRDFAALDVFEKLLAQYGTAGHMGVRDQSHSFFINRTRTGALDYKVLDKIAVIAGDPLCCPSQWISLLREFQAFCKSRRWGIAIIAASDEMAGIAQEQKWVTMRFGAEKVLNPMTNPLLLGTGGKRTVSKCRQLLKSGITVQMYCPSYQYDESVETQLVRIYETWCAARNKEHGTVQAFMTQFDVLSLPRLMAFIYTKNASGRMNGFAALRKLGTGYHVDPFIAAADAPKGTSDLLLYSAMSLASNAGVSRLSLGFEPVSELGDITGLPKMLVGMTRKIHRRFFSKLPLKGKKTFFDRLHPDGEQDGGLHIIYLQTPGPRHLLATMHFANISLRVMINRDMRDWAKSKAQSKKQNEQKSGDSSNGDRSAQE